MIMKTILLFNFFGPEMLVVLFAILLLFGGKKIPELMRGIGKGIKEFNTARSTLESELQEGINEAERKLEEQKRKQKELELEVQKAKAKQLNEDQA